MTDKLRAPPPAHGGGPSVVVSQAANATENTANTAFRKAALRSGERMLIAAFDRDDRSEWRVALDRDRSGENVIDIRLYEDFAGPAKARTPTKTGVSISLRHYRDLTNALTKLAVMAAEQGISLRDLP